jgi:stress response protein SCP2
MASSYVAETSQVLKRDPVSTNACKIRFDTEISVFRLHNTKSFNFIYYTNQNRKQEIMKFA